MKMSHTPKHVVYTVLVGAYDEIRQPQVLDDRFDYILFSNDIKEDSVGVWQIRPISYRNDDNTRVCRYVKTHPEELLSEYEASLWIDSNIYIRTPYVYERFIELYCSNTLVASMNHPWRDCIYDEAFEVMYLRYEKEKIVFDWCHKIRKEGYPRYNGLYETGVMYRKHSDEKVACVDGLWWNCIDEYSKRDQLSFNYVLWKCGLDCEYFLDKSLCSRNSDHFLYISHKKGKKEERSLEGDSWLMKYCLKREDKKEIVKERYFKIYNCAFPYLCRFIFGQYYRLKEVFRRYRRNFLK